MSEEFKRNHRIQNSLLVSIINNVRERKIITVKKVKHNI